VGRVLMPTESMDHSLASRLFKVILQDILGGSLR
jgi:hypothetical protein